MGASTLTSEGPGVTGGGAAVGERGGTQPLRSAVAAPAAIARLAAVVAKLELQPEVFAAEAGDHGLELVP